MLLSLDLATARSCAQSTCPQPPRSLPPSSKGDMVQSTGGNERQETHSRAGPETTPLPAGTRPLGCGAGTGADPGFALAARLHPPGCTRGQTWQGAGREPARVPAFPPFYSSRNPRDCGPTSRLHLEARTT